jgi:hypothetical protein
VVESAADSGKFRDCGYAEFVTEGTKFGLFERAKLPELIGRVARAGGPGGEVAFLVEDVDADPAGPGGKRSQAGTRWG